MNDTLSCTGRAAHNSPLFSYSTRACMNLRSYRADALMLITALIWVHVLLVGTLATRFDPIHVAFIQFVVCALISAVLALLLEEIDPSAIRLALPAILYGGLLAVAQKDAVASHAAIILSLEAVFAALAGWLVLNETLSVRGFIGCILMLTGMLIAQLVPLYRQRRHSPATVQQEPGG